MAVRRPLNDDISVIIPTYGRHQMLLRALDSIIGQSTRIREVIVVDDGSPNPITIPDRYNDHFPVKLVQHERNRGAAAARNTGLRLASGRWITFLDSDDVWLPGTLERRLADAQAHLNATGAALSCYVCGFEVVWMNANRRERRKPVGTSSLKDLVSGCWFAPGSCAIMLREPVLATVGPVDEDLRRLEDLDWFIRLGLAGGQIVANDLIGVRVEIRTKPGSRP